jgi:hypothetical protein
VWNVNRLPAGVLVQVLPPVEALLDVTAHPEHDIFSMSFGFWHKLSRQLNMTSLQQQQEQQQQPGSPVQPAAVAATGAAAAEQQRRREFFRPAFEKLISMVRGRMRWVGLWHACVFRCVVSLVCAIANHSFLVDAFEKLIGVMQGRIRWVVSGASASQF